MSVNYYDATSKKLTPVAGSGAGKWTGTAAQWGALTEAQKSQFPNGMEVILTDDYEGLVVLDSVSDCESSTERNEVVGAKVVSELNNNFGGLSFRVNEGKPEWSLRGADSFSPFKSEFKMYEDTIISCGANRGLPSNSHMIGISFPYSPEENGFIFASLQAAGTTDVKNTTSITDEAGNTLVSIYGNYSNTPGWSGYIPVFKGKTYYANIGKYCNISAVKIILDI